MSPEQLEYLNSLSCKVEVSLRPAPDPSDGLADPSSSLDLFCPVSYNSPLVGERFERTLEACYFVHVWTVNNLRQLWYRTGSGVRSSILSRQLTGVIADNPQVFEGVKRRNTLSFALESSIAYFYQHKRHAPLEQLPNGDWAGGVTTYLPDPMGWEEFTDFRLGKRKPWESQLLSRAELRLGWCTLYLEGDWQDFLIRVAQREHIPLHLLPKLIKSITLRKGMKVQWANSSGWQPGCSGVWWIGLNFKGWS